MSFKEFIDEGFLSSKKTKELKELYRKFNIYEDAILLLTNSTQNNDEYQKIFNYLNSNINGMSLHKEILIKIKKMNDLSNELLEISNNLKQSINDFNEKYYPEDFKGLK